MYLEHVGITVSDLERSASYYERLFGEARLENTSWRGESAEYVATMMGRPGLTLDAAFLRIPGSNVILELIEFQGVENGSSSIAHFKVGGLHMGFYVPDIDPIIERARAAGTVDIGETVSIQHGPYMGVGGRSVTFRDPDGNNLQLMEISGRPGNLPIPDRDIAQA